MKRDYKTLKEQMLGGTFFRATFVKKDGSVRNMLARTGVKSHLKGGSYLHGHSSKHPNLVPVYDVQKGAYRSINLDTLLELKAHGKTLKFEEN